MNQGETVNLVVVGDENTGKTSLLRVAANQQHPGRAYYKTTISSPRNSHSSPYERQDYNFAVATHSHGSVRVCGMDTVAVQEGVHGADVTEDRKKRYKCHPDIYLVCCRWAHCEAAEGR